MGEEFAWPAVLDVALAEARVGLLDQGNLLPTQLDGFWAFSSGDGSITRVDIVFENGAWVIKGIEEIAKK